MEQLSRSFATHATRRAALATLSVLGFGGSVGLAGETAAKRKRKKKKEVPGRDAEVRPEMRPNASVLP
jgi:hypothetical protein